MDDSAIRFHYTSDATIKILESQTIWLTHCLDLLDNTEGRFLLERLQRDLPDYQNITEILTTNLFIGCFCKHGDLNSQWTNYGPVNIGFDLFSMESDLHFVADANGKEHVTSGIVFGECLYTDYNDLNYQAVLNFVRSKLLNIESSSLPAQQYGYLSCCQAFLLKPSKYRCEHEFRIVCYLWQKNPCMSEESHKRYIKFHFTSDKVKSITIGPSPEKNTYQKQLNRFLRDSDKYDHVVLLDSLSWTSG